MRNETPMKNPLREGMESERAAAPCALVIYGASGDLTHRKLVPALFGLYQKHLLPAAFHLIGTSRTEIATEEFRANLKRFMRESIPQLSDALWEGFAQNIEYLSGGFDDPKAYANLATRLDTLDRKKGTLHNRIFYLSTPPNVFEPIIANLGRAGLHRQEMGFSRLVLEKPFGRDLESAQELNRKVREFFEEKQIYRIDNADKGEMETLFSNLLSNAVKYNKDGGNIELKIERDENGLVRISCADTGIGLTEEDLKRLFGEFVRIKNEHTRNIEGSGLGLSILKKLAALYGGEVKVSSEYGKGSVFTISLKEAVPVSPS